MTRRCAVLGSPVEHSLSPVLHRAAYDVLGLDWEYTAVDCDQARLPELLAGLDDEWVGLSLTMPLKRAVIPLLDEVSPLAANVRAVNTVVLGDKTRGDNTDAPGIAAALVAADCPRVDGALVLGGGATACSALAGLAALGATRATVAVRSLPRAQEALATGERLGLHVDTVDWPDAERLAGARLVISTVPTGAADTVADGFDGLRTRGVLLDVVYDPWPTRLAMAWEAAGGQVVGGLEMLVRQAALQVELFTGRRPPAGILRRAGEAALHDRQHPR